VELAPADVAMFRFLLEGYGHLAMFTTVDRRRTVLLVRFAPGAEEAVGRALKAIGEEISLRIVAPTIIPEAA
jgi:hypothetical protein